ncbi:hypothetical protein KCP76_01375 [Salmonella enterica subsp. enterica serovar Weltevreden]|nr:hypothetical protein KCP76_01375 [Salmonella enterica subsp. enterica serovar Weltevreden]
MTPGLTLVRPTLVPVGIGVIIRDTVLSLFRYRLLGTGYRSTASEAGGVKSSSQTSRRAITSSSLVGITTAGRVHLLC